jgi:hypothetical protein
MIRDKAGDRSGVAERQQRQRRRECLVRGDRHDMGIVGTKQEPAWPVH